jgi:uncharacterized tellurite resistance protein B-like protein
MNSYENSHTAFHRGTAPIFAILTGDQTLRLSQLQADPAVAEKIEQLAEKANEGLLSADERAEYEAYIEANNLLATLQAEARFRIASPKNGK